MKLDEGEGIVDVQICTEKDDVLLTTAQRPVHPLPGHRRARVPGPHLDGRARHQARRGRQGDLACRSCATSTATPRSARPISSAPARCGAAATATSRRRPTADAEEDGGERDRARRAALCRDVGGRAVHADGVGERLRQALLVLRVPDHRPRRQRHRRDGDLEGKKGAETIKDKIGRWSPRSRSRRPTRSCWSPTAGKLIRCPVERHPHRRPLDAGRDRVRHRRRRERGVGRAASAKRARRTVRKASASPPRRRQALTTSRRRTA